MTEPQVGGLDLTSAEPSGSRSAFAVSPVRAKVATPLKPETPPATTTTRDAGAHMHDRCALIHAHRHTETHARHVHTRRYPRVQGVHAQHTPVRRETHVDACGHASAVMRART